MSAPIDHKTLIPAPATPAPAPIAPPAAILPHELPQALDWFPQAKVLSLDCFDTLLWRDCHAPTDLFWTLTHISPLQRVHGESRARDAALATGRGQDIAIADIYARAMPHATHKERQAAIAAELDAEARHCYGFAPTIALMREAKARGLAIIIVSDTYLDSAQLRQLIAQAAGEDVAAMIDRVFCSSTYGKPKAAGLYGEVLRKVKWQPQDILHIGDNHGADVGGVAPFGVHTLHLKQFSEAVEQQLRQESAMGAMIHAAGNRLAAPQPHRPAIAVGTPQLEDAAQHVGYAVLGPVFTGFDRWLRAEAEGLRAAHGGTVHWLFLLRDGFLPMRVHETLGCSGTPHAIEISRFTSTAASFINDAAMRSYLEQSATIMPDIVARQLMLTPDVIDALIEGQTPQQGARNLAAHMKKEPSRKALRKAARAMADGLVRHVREAVRPQPGDTLMLVDLGYNGTVQNSIDHLLTDELKVHVAGRYLILRPTEMTSLDKRGYFDPEHYDLVALTAMIANVAVIEQLCTTPIGSVIGYTPAGEPIRRANDIKQRQSEVRDRVQKGCLGFAQSHAQSTQREHAPDELDLWRRANAATLNRLMYLPMESELAVFEAFEHDVNLGTDEMVPLFDRAIARHGLRQQGLFYSKGTTRMYLPAELAQAGMATRLAHFANNRFTLPLKFPDFANHTITVPVVYIDARNTHQTSFAANATHDGYFALCIPIGAARFAVAVQLGQMFEWVEVETISVLPAHAFLNARADTPEREVPVQAMLDGITQVAPRLWHCQSAGFALIQPPAQSELARADETELLLVMVFRPVVMRDAAQG